jgi:hypothetical protein
MPPWERYQQTAPQAAPVAAPKPWERYAPPPAQPQTAPRMPGPSAMAMPDPSAPQPQRPALSGAGEMYRADQEYQIAARQGTTYEIRDPQGQSLRPVLGEAYELDDGNVYFDGPDGKPVQADKAKHVVLRDPQSDKQMVYARTADSDQNKLLSLGQVLTPGLVTGPLTGVGRGAGSTRAAANLTRANELERDAQAFDTLGVRPFGPAFSQGPVAATAKQITELPVVGAPTARALKDSLTGARDATREVAARYGASSTAKEAGDVVQQGIERFKDARPAEVLEDVTRNLSDQRVSETIGQPASATSLKSKQAALYERAWRLIPEEMQKGRSVEGDTRFMSAPKATRDVIDSIVQRNLTMTNQAAAKRAGSDAVANPVSGGLLGKMIEAIRTPQWTANLQTLRNMRSDFRRLASGMSDTERNTLKLSDLERIQGAITQDMVEQLTRNAAHYREKGELAKATNIERSIREFKRADQFTRLSMQRLENIERLFKAESSESLFRNITNAALGGGKGNEQMLSTLRRTLRPEEMSEVAAGVLSEMGRPVGSARGATQELGYSVNSMLTKWQNMGERQKAMIFDGSHRQALDDAMRINSRLANVEALANTSRTLSNVAGIGGIGAAGALMTQGVGAIASALGSAGTMAAASYLFSRPEYVRWVIGYTRLKAAARTPQQAGKLTAEIQRLGQMAKSDPGLLGVYRALAGNETENEE